MVSFRWPIFLWGLLIVPFAAAGYLWLLRRRPPSPIRFPGLDDVVRAMGTRQRLRRHVPPAALLLALLAAAFAVSRPVIPLRIPTDRSAIMLAIDVSGSMLSQDVAPTRLGAAQSAANAFVAVLPGPIRIGLVTFAGDAVLHLPPTEDHQRVQDAIKAISVRHRTAIGDGLMEAVAALPGRVRPLPDGTVPPQQPGSRPPGIVVLLSDGQNNAGMDPLAAADLARLQEVTVYTVGIGQPMTPDNRWIVGGPLDEETLRAVAHRTGGEYFHPTSAGALREVYRTLARSVGWESQPVEVTGLIAALGAVLLIIALVGSVWLHPLR
ncbi:MAG TPA: VWA domain-containing protein [bacterium]|nr:VWA domain-containing protein [bacterium]